MEDWKVVYYEDADGVSEVYDYIEKQKPNIKAKILSWISMLEEKGPVLPRPYADLLKDGIHEFRIKLSGNQVRILYFFCYGNFIILTNHFKKNVAQVPEKEIKKADNLRQDFLERYSEKKLKEEYDENL